MEFVSKEVTIKKSENYLMGPKESVMEKSLEFSTNNSLGINRYVKSFEWFDLGILEQTNFGR